MESNKDEAQRALNIATRKRGEGDISGALKFARKSNALFATPAAASLISKLESDSSSSASGSTFTSSGTSGTAFSSATETHPSSSGATHRKQKEKEPEPVKREYTAENVAVVKRVRACRVTQYYEILGLEKDCSEARRNGEDGRGVR